MNSRTRKLLSAFRRQHIANNASIVGNTDTVDTAARYYAAVYSWRINAASTLRTLRTQFGSQAIRSLLIRGC